MFSTQAAKKIKTHILSLLTFFFLKSCRLWENVEKYCTAGQFRNDNTAHADCVLDN